MKKFLILAFSLSIIFANSVLACSLKDQLHLVFTGDNNNVSHSQIQAFSKSIFSDELLSHEIHTYSIDINHSRGTVIFDIAGEEQRKIVLEKINNYLKQNQLKSVRISYEKLLDKS